MSLKYEIKKTWIISYPIIIAQLGQMMMGFVDNLMVGQVGYLELAASAVGNGFYMLILIAGFGISMAISPFIAESDAENKIEQCGTIFNQSLLLNVIVSIILTLLTYFLSPLISFLGQEKEVEALAISYTKILSFSTTAFMVFLSYRGFNEGLSVIKPAMYISLIANVVNFFTNWIFIFGNLGAPQMGLDGAGIATLFSRVFMAIAIIIYTVKTKKFNKYIQKFKFYFDRIILKRLIRIGIASAMQYFFEAACFIFAAFMIGWINSIDQAAHQIAINLASLTYMCALGVSMGSAIRIANQYGKKDKEAIKYVAKSAWYLITLIMLINAIIFILFRAELAYMYNKNSNVVTIASSLLIVAAIFQISDGLQAVGLGILRGLSDVKIPTIITFISYWLIGIPIAYFLGFYTKLSTIGVWLGLLSGLISSAVFLILRFKNLHKKINF